ncbi:MAG: YwaF family protein [Candidatus Izemoplasmatales bacterium]
MVVLSAPMFGDKHLIGVLFVVILFILFGSILKILKYSNKRRIIFVFMIIFYVLEIAKMSYLMYPDGSYPIYQLPFHLCSLPLYLYPIMYFFDKSKFVENYIKPTAYSLVLIAGVVALALPTNILGNAISWFPLKDNILPIISFIYHGFMIFSSVYLLKSKYYKFNIHDYPKTMAIAISFAVIAMIANKLLDKDFMLLNRGSGSPLMFIIETSRPLYIIAMIGGFSILTGTVFLVTELLINRLKVKAVFSKSM